MHVKVGDKITTPMADGRLYPAIVITRETAEPVTIAVKVDGKPTGETVDIEVTRAEVLSLRTTREGVEYTAVTNEVIQYGYRSVAMPRFDAVVGLDVNADGTIRTLTEAMADHAKTYGEWQAANYEARRGTVSAADL